MTQSSHIRHEGSQFKNCKKCGEAKPLTEFHRNRNTKDGRVSVCKPCAIEITRKWREENPERALESCRKWARDNPEKVRENNRKWLEANRDRHRELNRQWAKKYPEKARAKSLRLSARWRKNHPEEHRERARIWRENNPEKAREMSQRWRAENPDYENMRWKSDPRYRAAKSFRTRFYRWFIARGQKKESAVMDAVGCTKDELIQHIEAQFEPGMTWDNWSFDGWHIDHKIPLSSAGDDVGAVRAENILIANYDGNRLGICHWDDNDGNRDGRVDADEVVLLGIVEGVTANQLAVANFA